MRREQKSTPTLVSSAWSRALVAHFEPSDLALFLDSIGETGQPWIPLTRWNHALAELDRTPRPLRFWQDLGALLEASAMPVLPIPTWLLPLPKVVSLLLRRGFPKLLQPLDLQIAADGSRHLELTLRLGPDALITRPFQDLITGIFESLTLHLAAEPSQVSSELISNSEVRYLIDLPRSRTLAARFTRSARSLLSRKSALETLLQQQAEVSGKERALTRLRGDFESILENNPIGILVHQKSKLAYANPALLRMAGQASLATLQASSEFDLTLLATRLQGGDSEWNFPSGVIANVTRGTEIDFRGDTCQVSILRDITSERRLEKELLRSAEAERERISFDIHDGMGQLLTGSALRAHALHLALVGDRASEAAEALEISELLNSAIERSQSLARGLNPVSEFEGGFAEALKALAAPYRDLVSLDLPDPAVPLGSGIENQLYRIVQEALTNAVRHSGATGIKIKWQGDRLTIADNGQGFIKSQINELQSLGFRSMRYRARTINAVLKINPSPNGTVITIDLRRSKER